MEEKKIRVLSIFRASLKNKRGTPIRVLTLLQYLSKYKDIELITCSTDAVSPVNNIHVPLKGNVIVDFYRILSVIRSYDIDIVVGHTLTAWPLMIGAKVLLGVKSVLEMHGFLEEEAKMAGKISIFRYWRNKIFYQYVYRFMDAISTCSETASEAIRVFNQNTITIYGGVDENIFRPDAKSVGKVPKVGIVIGYAGNVRKWQGTDFLINAFEQFKVDNSEYHLVIVSSGKNDLSEIGDLKVFGPVEHYDVPGYLVDCDILVIPREQNEVNRLSFPSKLPEYLAMGKAVVASRTSDCHRIIQDGQNGLLYEPGDALGLMGCLAKLADFELRKKLGENARLTVLKNFTWKAQAGLFYTLLRDQKK